jgi:hypothetical protein
MPNQITGPIPAAKLTEALNLLQQARTVLAPYLHPLTPDQRQHLAKMGDRSVGFMTKLLDYAANTPAFVPAFVDFAELKQDVGVATALAPLEQLAAQLAHDLESTVMLAGAEGMAQASPVYKNIKFLAEQNQPGAQSAYDELKTRFPGRSGNGAAKKQAASA